MTSQTNNMNIETKKMVTLSQKELKKEPRCKVQYGQVMEDNSISWSRVCTATLYLDDGCVNANDFMYGCQCDGIYFEWNVGGRFLVAKSKMGDVREANHFCFRICEVLDKETKESSTRGRKRKVVTTDVTNYDSDSTDYESTDSESTDSEDED